jgi:hypothetical protein
MVFGVVLDGVVEFWTRGGRTDEAVKVTRWVHEQRVALGSEGPDCVGLVLAADAMGQTVIFEWVGRQARIKVKELETRLVVLQVRDKVTGAYVKFEQREALAMRFQVACVARVTELEGRRLGRVFHGVKTDMTRFEGVVLQLVEGKGSDGDVTVSDIPLMLKVKTQWWLNAEQHKYQRWRSEEQHEHEEERRHRKRKHNAWNVRLPDVVAWTSKHKHITPRQPMTRKTRTRKKRTVPTKTRMWKKSMLTKRRKKKRIRLILMQRRKVNCKHCPWKTW